MQSGRFHVVKSLSEKKGNLVVYKMPLVNKQPKLIDGCGPGLEQASQSSSVVEVMVHVSRIKQALSCS